MFKLAYKKTDEKKKPFQAFVMAMSNDSWSLSDPVPVFPGSYLNSCCSFSLSLRSVKKYLQPSGLSLSLFTFTHYVCTDASHFAILQLGFGLISQIWIDFDFTRSPVEVLKRRIVSLLNELHVSFGNFRK